MYNIRLDFATTNFEQVNNNPMASNLQKQAQIL